MPRFFSSVAHFLSRVERAFFAHALIILLAAYLLLMLNFNPYFRFADNVYFSASLYRWGGDHAHHVICWSNLLSYPLACLARLFPSIEWYTLYIYVCHFAIFASVAFALIQTREKPGIRNYAGVVLLVVYVLQYMFEVEFTFVSFFTMTGGLLLILRAGSSGYRKSLCGLGIVVFMMGSVLRCDSCIGMMPFMGTLFFVVYFYEKERLPRSIALTCCAAFALSCYLLQDSLSTIITDDGKEFCFTSANKARAKFTDYRDDSGLDKDDMYQRIGCSRNELNLLENWMYYSDECRNAEYWQKMAEIRDYGRSSFSLSRCWELMQSQLPEERPYCWSILGCAILLLVRYQRRPQPSDWVVLAGLLCLLLLGMRGRFNDRAMMAVLLPCISLWAMLLPSFKMHRIAQVVFILIPAFFFIRHGCLNERIKQYLSPWGQPKWENAELSSTVLEECNTHPELLYFAEVHRWRRLTLPGSSLLSRDMQNALNFFPLGGWNILFPSCQSALSERGITQLSHLLLYDQIRLVLSAESVQDLLAMKSKDDPLFHKHRLEYFFTFVQERYGIRLRLEVEKQLAEGLYVARVLRMEE